MARRLDYKQPTRGQLRHQAYLILGVEPNVVLAGPKITHFISRMPGGWQRALEYLRASDLPEARHFISKYDNMLLPQFVRRLLPIEAFAVAASISPTRLWGVIVESARIFEGGLGSLTAAAAHTRVVQASIDSAVTPEGLEDRAHQLKHMNFLPMPKGSQVNVNVSASAAAQTQVAQATVVDAPSPEATIRGLIERQNRFNTREQPALPSAEGREVVPEIIPRVERDPVYVEQDYVDEEADD